VWDREREGDGVSVCCYWIWQEEQQAHIPLRLRVGGSGVRAEDGDERREDVSEEDEGPFMSFFFSNPYLRGNDK
jgi:hypothetical protein